MKLELDHVLIAVADLAEAAREFEARYGLTSIEGGRHPGWGTANRIVPLGATYLELVAVVDDAEAAQSDFGRWIAGASPSRARPVGWAVRTQNLDDVAQRLSLMVRSGSRVTGSGQLLQWRLAGVEQAAVEPSLPFFIEWEQGTRLPGEAPVTHRAGRVHIGRLELAADGDRVAHWLGPHRLPITVTPGTPSLSRVVLATTEGDDIILDAR